MARLGEQLTAAGVVSADKVEQALRAQVVWGARLGTNLIELGCIDLDELSRALGQLHGVPAALARHFEKADPVLQARLPADVAKRFNVVPLVRLSDERIAVVALDPLGAAARDALSGIYGIDPFNGVVVSIAAEMRVLYHLERVYQIARPTRYLRQKGANVTPFPHLDMSFELDIEVEPEVVAELAPIDIDIDVEPEVEVEGPGSSMSPSGEAARPQVSLAEVEALLEEAIESSPELTPPAGMPVGRDRRTYLRTLADDDKPAARMPNVVRIPPKPPTVPPPPSPALDTPTFQAPSFDAPTVSKPAATAEALRSDAVARGVAMPVPVPAPAPVPAVAEPVPAVAEPAVGEAPADAESKPATSPLGRIAIRRVAVAAGAAPVPADKPVDKPIVPTNFLDSTRAIKRGPNRDRVAELVIESLERYVPSCHAALLLVIRGDVAIGWKHFSRADDGTSEVAVPLDQDGIVPTAIARKTTTRCEAGELGSLDVRLLRAVGNGDGADLAVVPIMIADQVMCLLCAATAAEAESAPLEAVASAASAAFARLIRDASR